METRKEYYQRMKRRTRNSAIWWQHHFDDVSDLFELCQVQQHFEKLGKRYGLIKEFKENGII